MNQAKGLTSGLISLLVATLLAAAPAVAQDDDERARRDAQETKQAQAVSKEIYEQIQKAQELVDVKEYDEALRILDRLRKKDSLTDYERQNVLNYVGFVHYNMDNIEAAIATYEEMLQIPTMEDQVRKQTTYTLAQLSTMQEQYTKALTLLDQYFVLETNPAADAWILYAQNLYQEERYADMVPAIEKGMEIAEARNKEVKEDWYVLLNFAYFQQENYEKVRDIQKILLVKWPKKRYWFSLAGAYTELGEDDNLIYAYDAAHVQGLLEKESELVTMAQLYLQAEVPYQAGTLLAKEMEAGRVSGEAKNWRLLSQAWQLAQEDERAIPALQAAAKATEDGELDVRLGNAYLNLSQYQNCADAVRQGLRKGGLKKEHNAQISLGMCLYNLKEYQAAIAAFREAGKNRGSRTISNQWVAVINSDIERNEQIRLAEAAARRQAEALEKRLAQSERI